MNCDKDMVKIGLNYKILLPNNENVSLFKKKSIEASERVQWINMCKLYKPVVLES